MAKAEGRPWSRVAGAFKKKCKDQNAECWLCRGAEGPIKYDAPAGDPLGFNADHKTPTSLGGELLKHSNLAPSHSRCNSARGNTTRGMFPTSRRW